MKVCELYDIIDAFAPFAIAMEQDNPGLLIGHGQAEITNVLVTLDADESAMRHALETDCNTVVSHHPFIFSGENHLTDQTPQGSKMLFAVENRLNIISAHTNLDACPGGINDTLAALLHIEVDRSFSPTQNGGFLGRIGHHDFKNPTAFLAHAAETLHTLPRFRLSNDRFDTLALVSGSGTSALEQARAAGADTLITGDAKYSAFMNAAEMGINLVDLGHFETEQIIVPVLSDLLRQNGVSVVEHIIASPIKTFTV